MCAENDWLRSPGLAHLRVGSAGDLGASPAGSREMIIPLITVTCMNCGFTPLFAAETLGLVD